ncbi:hypothetical protein Pcinc_019752 [Petrolisthes cinctipes]|uniref:Rab3 GTPase-activating protein catalytic subunit n=1 Tax=Petrolisthes cinctipes TaxID=88211 RepID=A0AAE1FKM2_PETCI|nr:hypothetical protein Pcinc_019752 [Petrolisthes cinctipes]
METQDADDQEVFEIVDFTTASEWECFIATVEETIHEWRLSGERPPQSPLTRGQLATARWREKNVVIKFADFPFMLTHHSIISDTADSPPEESADTNTDYDSDDESKRLPQFLEDMMNRDNDFPARAHCLVRWYGAREMLTLAPANPRTPITCPSKSRLLLSSVTIAANNTNCQVPLFVQVHQGSSRVYVGVGLGSGVRTDFNMVYLKHPPPQCSHLAGLLDVFRNKLQCTVTSQPVLVSPVLVSVRFTYVLKEWPHTLWTQQPPDFDATLTEVGFSDLGKLPFGALSDPVSELHVSATWPCVSEDVLVDSDVYSDLDPVSAPLWTARLIAAPSPPCLLSEYLTEFLDVCRSNLSIAQVLGPAFLHDLDPDPDHQISSALDRLTKPAVPSLSAVVGRVRRSTHRQQQHTNKPQHQPTNTNTNNTQQQQQQSGSESGPIPIDILVPILNYLFPDAEGEQPSFPYQATLSQVPEWRTEDGDTQEHPLKSPLSNMKSSGSDGLVWRLGVSLCHVIHCLGGLAAAAHLWHEVVLELRFRWEHCVAVPGVGGGPPDLASTLLHQKLQMLNCCIARRNAREQATHISGCEDMEEEDEFFECEEEVEDEEDERSSSSNNRGGGVVRGGAGGGGAGWSSWDKPEGRLKRCGTLRLLHTGEPLYIPVTQDPAPVTEDRLEEHTDALLRLGTDSLGSHLRARLMSAALLSDMESFKAANPGAALEDFVRWYSPRDWIEEGGTEVGGGGGSKDSQAPPNPSSHPPQGSLSTRMQIPGNMWKEVWNSAKPVPARRQKRLFDDTRGAEEVLHWLGSLGPGAACCHLLPTVLHAAICRLAQERLLFSLPASTTPLPQPRHSNTLASVLNVIAQRATRLSRQPPDPDKYQELVEQVAEVEACVARAQSVRHKILGDNNGGGGGTGNGGASCDGGGEGGGEGGSERRSTLEDLVLRLLDSPEVTLEGGPRGEAARVVQRLFQQAYKASQLLDDSPGDSEGDGDIPGPGGSPVSELGRPVGREYLLRTTVPAPSPASRPLPHRMFAVLLPGEFRLTGAFSQDTIFCAL